VAVVIAYVAALISAVCYGLGSVLQSIAAKKVEEGEGGISLKDLSQIAKQLPYAAGILLDGLGWLFSLVALFRLPLFVVQAVVAASVGFVVLFSALFEKVVPTRRQVLFLVGLAVGLLGLAASGAPESARSAPGWFGPTMWVALFAFATAGFVLAKRTSGSGSASALGAIAGLSFGGTALCARSLSSGVDLHLLLEPAAWAMALFGALGMVLFATALQRGSVTVTTAWLFTAETIAPAIVGMVALGDRSRPGMGLIALVSFLVTVAAAVGLTLVSPEAE
jgi:drug/metabolite transporter (DMT)-like permease